MKTLIRGTIEYTCVNYAKRFFMNKKGYLVKALVTGVSGQDGRFISKELHKLDIKVYGLIRRNYSSLDEFEKEDLREVELLDFSSLDSKILAKYINDIQPDFIFNLLGESSVVESFNNWHKTFEANTKFFYYLMNIILDLPNRSEIRIFQASSSEMFGYCADTPQNETSIHKPNSPYGISKSLSHQLAKYFRDSEGLFVSTGIMYNHESEKRSRNFVSRKISSSVAAIKMGLETKLVLGNLDSKRDWGYAEDYVKAVVKIILHEQPEDFIIASGKSRSVREFAETALRVAEIEGPYSRYIESNSLFAREKDSFSLVGDSTKIRSKLGWKETLSFEEMVAKMVRNDIILLGDGRY